MALKAIACVNVLALVVAIPMFIEGTFHATPVRSLHDSKKTFHACAVRDYSEDPNYRTLFSVYSVIRALLINVGPCTVLVILNAILVERMKEAKQNRDKLMRRRSCEVRSQEQTNVTLMLVGDTTNIGGILENSDFCSFSGYCGDNISHRGNTHGHLFDRQCYLEIIRIGLLTSLPAFRRTTVELCRSPLVSDQLFHLLSHVSLVSWCIHATSLSGIYWLTARSFTIHRHTSSQQTNGSRRSERAAGVDPYQARAESDRDRNETEGIICDIQCDDHRDSDGTVVLGHSIEWQREQEEFARISNEAACLLQWRSQSNKVYRSVNRTVSFFLLFSFLVWWSEKYIEKTKQWMYWKLPASVGMLSGAKSCEGWWTQPSVQLERSVRS